MATSAGFSFRRFASPKRAANGVDVVLRPFANDACPLLPSTKSDCGVESQSEGMSEGAELRANRSGEACSVK